jgi:hypothetical protein
VSGGRRGARDHGREINPPCAVAGAVPGPALRGDHRERRPARCPDQRCEAAVRASAISAIRSQHYSQPMRVRVRERTGLHFESIVPIPSTHTLGHVAADRERPWLPLFDDMPILVEHQPGVVEELSTTSAQVDSASPCGGNGPAMKPHK